MLTSEGNMDQVSVALELLESGEALDMSHDSFLVVDSGAETKRGGPSDADSCRGAVQKPQGLFNDFICNGYA